MDMYVADYVNSGKTTNGTDNSEVEGFLASMKTGDSYFDNQKEFATELALA